MATTRRTRGDGSVYRRADGRWAGISSIVQDGKRRRRYVYGATKAEAARKLRELDRAPVVPEPVIPPSRTFGAFTHEWLAEILPRQVRASTVDSYTFVLRQHVLPILADRPLAAITPRDVEEVTQHVLSRGRSPRAAALTHTLIRRVLGEPERRGKLARKVGRIAIAPRVPRREGRTLRPRMLDGWWRRRRRRHRGAVCEDGSRSSATGNGACSGHSGVEDWLYEDIPDNGNEYRPAP